MNEYGPNFKRMAKLEDCGVATSKHRERIVMEVFDERGIQCGEYVDDGKEGINKPSEKIISKDTLPFGFMRKDHDC